MDLARNAVVAARFGARAGDYDRHAALQRTVAAGLAALLPARTAPRVLEVGCGTGLLSRHLLEHYPDGNLTLTDLSRDMLLRCRAALGRDSPSLSFALMDADEPDTRGSFNVIATSMTLQWLADPERALERLRRLLAPGGVLLYATLGRGTFPEWRDALTRAGLAIGAIEMPDLPGVVREETHETVGGAHAFLAKLRSLGASVPVAGYRPLSPGALRRAMRMLNAEHKGRVTWRIVYGRLEAAAPA